MNILKKTILLFILYIILNHTVIEINASSIEDSETNLEVVLILDSSQSMLYTDPSNIRYEAIKLFIDMCHNKNDRIGLIAFGSNIIKSIPLTTITTPPQKENLKSSLKDIPCKTSTDLGLSLKQAVEILQAEHIASNKPLLILLSDGNNDPDRPLEESAQDIANALQQAKEYGYPIYSIGLNSEGSIDQTLLQKISSETNGQYFVVDSANDLPVIFSNIFADILQIKIVNQDNIAINQEYTDIPIEIPSLSINELNIAIMTQNKIDLLLTNSQDEIINMPTDNIYYTFSNRYSLIKIVNPTSDNLILKLKSDQSDTATINLLYDYNIQLTTNITPMKNLHIGESIYVNAYLSSDKVRLNDHNLYTQVTGTLIIKNTDTGTTKMVELTNNGNSFEGEYVFNEYANYSVSIQVEGKTYYRTSSPFQITIDKVITKESLSAEYDSNEIPIEIELSEDSIVSSIDSSDAVDIIPVLLIIIFILIAFSIFFVIIRYAIGKKKKMLHKPLKKIIKENKNSLIGTLMLEVIDDTSNDTSVRYPPISIRLSSYNGIVTLYQLLSCLPEYNEASKIKIFLNGQQMVFLNTSDFIVYLNNEQIQSKHSYIIHHGDSFKINLHSISKIISLNYYAH